MSAVNFLWSDVPLFSTPAKIFSNNVIADVNLGSSGLVISCGYIACLKLEPVNQVEINLASLNRVEKKIRDIFFDVPIEVGQSLVTLPALVADFLFVEILLSANWMKAVGACLDINRLEIVVDRE